MKIFITILLFVYALATYSQLTAPILRIETGMHSTVTNKISADAAGRLFLTCSDDKTARLWDASDGSLLNILRIPIYSINNEKISCCALSPDGKLAALGFTDNYDNRIRHGIYIYNIQTTEILYDISEIPNTICEMEFSPNGQSLVVAFGTFGEKCGIKIFNSNNWKLISDLAGYKNPIFSVCFDNANRLAVADNESKIRLYDAKFQLIVEQRTSPFIPYSISFNNKGDQLAVAYNNQDDAVEIRNSTDLTLLIKTSLHTSHVDFSPTDATLYGHRLIFNAKSQKFFNILTVSNKKEYTTSKEVSLIMKNQISDFKVLATGNIAILGMLSPDLMVTNPDGQIIWYKPINNIDLIIDDLSHLKINTAGNIIGFTPNDYLPLTFDVTNRKSEIKQSEFPSYTDNNYTEVTCWESRSCGGGPVINNIKVDFISTQDATTCVDVTNNGHEIVLGGRDNLYKADAKSNLIWKVPLPAGAFGGVNISGNNKVVAAALGDGTIRWYSMADGKELLAFYLHADKKRWVLFTPSGYYDASPGAEEFLGWHLNNGPDKTPDFFPVSRFKEKFYRPDIIDAIFETYTEEDAITLANQRSSKKIITTATDIRQKLPPTVIINSPANGSKISNNTVSINYAINSPDDAPAKNLRVLIDGRPVATERGLKPVASSVLQKITITVPSQDCIITLLAENDNGISPETNLYLKWETAVATKEEFVYKPKLYVLSIGLSEYNNPQLKLGFAAKDAGDFANTVYKQKGILYSDVVVKKLTNKEATKDGIIEGLDWIQKQTGHKDVAMIFYAGHGINDNNGIFYMLPVAADPDRIRVTCLNFEELKQTVSAIAGKVVVFIDACHSGNVMGSNRRGGSDINAVVNELSNTENGAITFTSSTGKEYSLEDVAWGNGAFTKAVIEGLNGKAVINGKNKITIKSLDAYISERVKEITGGKQHPTSVSPPNVPDFPIAVTQ